MAESACDTGSGASGPRPGHGPGRRDRRLAGIAVAAILLLASAPAAAHRLHLFVTAEPGAVSGRVYFAGGHPAPGARIEVLDAEGATLAELRPDAQGAFSYRPERARDLVLRAESADGHRREWRVAASQLEMASASEPGRAPAAEAGRSASQALSQRAAAAADRTGRAELDPAVVAAIERAVARQVRPLREALAEAQTRARVQDILGGVGYIAGIAGLGLWWTTRRSRRSARTGRPE